MEIQGIYAYLNWPFTFYPFNRSFTEESLTYVIPFQLKLEIHTGFHISL